MRIWLIAMVAVLLSAAPAAAQAPLRVLLLPYTNAAALMRIHQPLREHLQRELGRPVELFTSADFVAHFEDIRKGDFDVAVTGPHFGAYAVQHGARALLRYRATLTPVLAVRKGTGLTDPAQLKGKVVSASNRLSTSSLAGERWLAERGLVAGRDYELRASATHTTAIMAVAMGEVDAALTTHTPIHQAPEDVRARIEAIPAPSGVPHLFTIARPTLPEAEVRTVRAAFLAFGESAAGREFFAASGYQGYVPLTAEDVAAMRPVVDLLLTALPKAQP
ncbi:phosphate/phosphite/phosphonate ABC transporter substrate-binding protein [Magnetospirillum sp. UT-4]|uniref:phosphate/phosphite/phosphonate ABC transporter substrate-binding protein n=1 Tax=Magnetospirillum sp. UT-4 TaxID=2681467 RepID=UPI001573CEF2|nr:phosphate/phosphite/phosphonate ABC transporter substrate-binding protein [Magnetospirillum sp. UT-4]